MKKLIMFTSIFALFAAPALADEEVVAKSATAFPHGLELGLGVSATTGLNGFVGYVNKNFDSFWLRRIGVRADFATTKPLKSTINSLIDKYMDDGIEVGDYMTITDGSIESHHFAALVDFYPFGDAWFLGGWRISGGYVFGDAKIEANLTGNVDKLPSQDVQFQLGNTYYKYSGNELNGVAKMNWKLSGPYLGTGFDIGILRGFKLFLDAGVVFTSKAAELSLDVPTDNLQQSTDGTTWTPVNVSQLETVKADTIKDAQDELDKYKFFPMVKLGLMYRF